MRISASIFLILMVSSLSVGQQRKRVLNRNASNQHSASSPNYSKERLDINGVTLPANYQGHDIIGVYNLEETGDQPGPGRGAIEEAAAQVLRGVNGMVNCLAFNPKLLGDQRRSDLLPVIFTTARIWTSDVDLSSANLTKGQIDMTGKPLTERPWVFFQYHLSPGLKHTSSPSERADALGDLMEHEYVRTVAVVSAAGIEKFLMWSSHLDLW
jgi:hypothetical protein